MNRRHPFHWPGINHVAAAQVKTKLTFPVALQLWEQGRFTLVQPPQPKATGEHEPTPSDHHHDRSTDMASSGRSVESSSVAEKCNESGRPQPRPKSNAETPPNSNVHKSRPAQGTLKQPPRQQYTRNKSLLATMRQTELTFPKKSVADTSTDPTSMPSSLRNGQGKTTKSVTATATATQQSLSADEFGEITTVELDSVDPHLLNGQRVIHKPRQTKSVLQLLSEDGFGSMTMSDLDGIDLEGQPVEETSRMLIRSDAKRKRQMEASESEDDRPLRPARQTLRSAQPFRSTSPRVSAQAPPTHSVSPPLPVPASQLTTPSQIASGAPGSGSTSGTLTATTLQGRLERLKYTVFDVTNDSIILSPGGELGRLKILQTERAIGLKGLIHFILYDGVTTIDSNTPSYKKLAQELRSLQNSTVGLGERRRYIRMSAVKPWALQHELGPLFHMIERLLDPTSHLRKLYEKLNYSCGPHKCYSRSSTVASSDVARIMRHLQHAHKARAPYDVFVCWPCNPQSTATQQPFDDDDFGAITAAEIEHLLDGPPADESAATPPVSIEEDFGDFTLTDLDGIDLEGQPADETTRRLTRSEAKRKRQMEAEDDEDDDMPLRPGRRNLRSAQLLRSHLLRFQLSPST
jgi:hypothetical protein